MTTSDEQEPEKHECVLPETRNFLGRPQLGPCKVCGRPAAVVLEMLRGDRLRSIVRLFVAEAERFQRAAIQTSEDEASHRRQGQALARIELFDRLKAAGLDVVATPLMDGPSEPSPRHAQAVRNLHHLESLGDDSLGVAFSACAADGHVSDDLVADPCPTLRALNETDPPPVAPIVDVDKLTDEVWQALNSALCNGGVPGWSMLEEARKVAATVAETLPTIDLDDPEIVYEVGLALTHPSLYATRKGAVPDHQRDAVLAALRKVLK